MLNIYIVKDPATGDYVVVKEGETGYYELDENKRHDAEYAERINAALGHTEEDLTNATARAMFGTW